MAVRAEPRGNIGQCVARAGRAHIAGPGPSHGASAKPGSTVAPLMVLLGVWSCCGPCAGMSRWPGGPAVSFCCLRLVLLDGEWSGRERWAVRCGGHLLPGRLPGPRQSRVVGRVAG